ncbi:hypothetical protein LCGC14_0687820 [marine sediment metagenome]|uniref:Uncharacterized protein n=1 Tax=marine sediment metagenome TaxID=412755 RepID=A0A0F9T7L4_9ZZZZ
MERYRYKKKCIGCENIFYSDRANRRFHSDDCMRAYYDKKYGPAAKKGGKRKNGKNIKV